MTETTRHFGNTPIGVDNGAVTVLSELASEVSSNIDVEPLPLKVPTRPNITVIYKPDFDFDMLRLWSRRAVTSNGKDADPMKLAYAVLTHCCRGFLLKGDPVHDSEGGDLTFTHAELRKMFNNSRTSQEAIKWLYGKEGHIIVASRRVIEAAGYGDIDMEAEEGPLGD